MATNTWSAAGAGNWSTAGNWSLGHKPAAGEDVVLDATSVFACTLNESSVAFLASFTVANAYTGTFTMNAYCYLFSTGSVSFGTGCTVAAAATSVVSTSGAGTKFLTTNGAVLGALAHAAGAAGLTLQNALTLSGTLTVSSTFAQNGKTISCAVLVSNTALATYDAAVTVAGSVSFVTAAPVSFPTTLTMTATGYLAVVAGSVLNAVVIDAGAGTVTLSTALSCASVNVSSGSFVSANKAITVTTGWYDNATAVNLGSSVLTLAGGATYVAILSGTRTTSGATIQHTGTSNVIVNIGTYTTTVSRLILKAKQSYLFTASNNIATISNHTAGDWDNMTWRSTFATGAYHISAPAGVAPTGLNVTDCHNVGAVIDASDGTCTDGGGNEGFDFGGGAIPVMFNHYRRLRAA